MWPLRIEDGQGKDGLWWTDFTTRGSTNLREARTVMNHLLAETRQGRPEGCDIWSASDNDHWSQLWHKGM